MKKTTRTLTYSALFTALVAIATMAIQFPLPVVGGYINVGDCVIFLSAIIFSPLVGLVAGGIGSMLADVLTSFAIWAPFTLVIKGVEGFLCGIFFVLLKKHLNEKALKKLCFIPMLLATIFMAIGYTVATQIIYQNVEITLLSIPSFFIQGAISTVLAFILLNIFKFKKFDNYL